VLISQFLLFACYHNEEREERLEREREQRERLAKKEQEQAKVNEERALSDRNLAKCCCW
jgi:serine protease Do